MTKNIEKEKMLLKKLNLKATPKRIAILQTMAHVQKFLSPEEIWGQLSKKFKQLGLPTIYRNLEEMEKGGLISSIMRPNRRLYYFLCTNESHHHHFICTNCNQVEDLDICIAKEVENEIKKRFGGIVKSHIMQVDGLCAICQKN